MSYIISLLTDISMGSAAGCRYLLSVEGVSQLCRNKDSVPFPVRCFLNLARSADRAFAFYFVFHALTLQISK